MNLQTSAINQQNQSSEAGRQLQAWFLQFLKDKQEVREDPITKEQMTVYKYRLQGEKMIEEKKKTLEVDSQDVIQENQQSFEEIMINFNRYETYLQKAVFEFISFLRDHQAVDTEISTAESQYYISFYNYEYYQTKLRGLKLQYLGRMATFNGTVTRSSDVRPELILGAFRCSLCNTLIKGIQQEYKFTEPKFCRGNQGNCKNTSEWKLEPLASSFTDMQKLRVQEDSGDIPPGGMPRSMDVILRDEICNRVKPGDKVKITGYLIVVPDIQSLTKPGEKNVVVSRTQDGTKGANSLATDGITGLKQLGQRDLNYRLAFNGNSIIQVQDSLKQNKNAYSNEDFDEDEEMHSYEQIYHQFTSEEMNRINQMQQDPKLYKNLAQSIAPTVHGSEDIKKGILLMLFGGIHKRTREGINLRGDLNVCIVGDPSTGKSQFLKYVANFLPRSVYTSGKASSAAGLTASVQRDEETGEYCVEAGALMLADHGVCCIDEFDKMGSGDQVAIHEAMEQQTISIAKAGIQATLNARASILAAANPLYGRYDKSKTLKQNLDMSAPIMSRFDLFFVVLDKVDQNVDKNIAKYILGLHQHGEDSLKDDYVYSKQDIQLYLRFSRFFKPKLTNEAADALRKAYVQLRRNDSTSMQAAYKITVRQLESLIRLSEALARVHVSEKILPEYVKEAQKLLSNSIIRIEKDDLEMRDPEDDEEEDFEGKGNETLVRKMQEDKQAEEKRKQNVIKLNYEKFMSMATEITNYMKLKEEEQQLHNEQNPDEGLQYGVVQRQIIEDYIKDHLEELPDESEATIQTLYKTVQAVIKRMHRVENILILVQENQMDQRENIYALHDNQNI